MKTLEGTVKGCHDGLMYYTIGQRQGLGIGRVGNPWFVVGKNSQGNTLYVEQGYSNDKLYSDRLLATNVNWINPNLVQETFTRTAKFRYRQADSPVTVTILENGRVDVVFVESTRAVTPGQAVVFYDGDVCLSGGTIDEVFKDNHYLDYAG